MAVTSWIAILVKFAGISLLMGDTYNAPEKSEGRQPTAFYSTAGSVFSHRQHRMSADESKPEQSKGFLLMPCFR